MYWWNRIVKFDRKPLDRDLLVGFVLEFSGALTLIALVDQERFDLNRYAVFRNSDVRRCQPVAENSLLVRALRVKDIQPVRRRLSLASWTELLEPASKRFPLITIFGRLASINRVSFELKGIGTDASWDKSYRYKFSDVTCVGFGGGYEDALTRMAAADALLKKSPR